MPIARLSGVVGERDNRDYLTICYGHEGERKSVKDQSFCTQLGSFANYGYERWVGFTELCSRLLKGINEVFSQTGHFQFIPSRSLDQFFGSFRANPYPQNQLVIRALARTMASSASKSSALPDSMSLILRQISASHASATCKSAGPSKLATKSRASLARSLSGKVIAALVIISSCTVFITSSKT